MLTPDETLGLLSQVTEVLNRLGIEYIIAGGVAISAYTKPRATKDIDIVIKKDMEGRTLKQLKTILRRMGWKYEGINDEFAHKRYLFSKSVLGEGTRNYMELWIGGISYTRRFDTDTWKRKKKRKMRGVTLILPCVEDLLASKTALERDSIDVIYHAKSQAVDDICRILNTHEGSCQILKR